MSAAIDNNPLVKNARAKQHYEGVLFEAKHNEEITEQFLKVELSTVWEALGEDAQPAELAEQLRAALASDDWLELGTLLGPTAKAYVRQQAVDDVREAHDYQAMFEDGFCEECNTKLSKCECFEV